jgi:hypothetical protein
MIVLHHGWRSSASRRVRLCLEEKGLKYESHVVDMANLEHHSPEYLKINPLGVIPTMIHDGKPLHDLRISRRDLSRSPPASGKRVRPRVDAQLDPPYRRADRQSHRLQLAASSAEDGAEMDR